MYNNPSKFFDTILAFLASDYNRIFTIEEVKNYVYKKQIDKTNKLKDFILSSDEHFETNTINAVMFLNREGLVTYNGKEKQVFINTKGFVKHKTENFTQEIRNKTINLWLQRGTWLCSIVALFVSAYAISVKNSDSTTTVSSCSCKPLTTLFGQQQKAKIEVSKSKETLPQKQE